MPNNANDPERLEADINKLIEEELPVDEDPLPAAANVEEAVNRILPDHYTFDVKDDDLKKPLSSLNILPNKMYGYSGNEDGEFNIVIDNGLVSGLTEKTKWKHRNEDGIFFDADSQTGIVMDGVGSTMHGETASSVGIYSAAQLMKKSREKGTPPLPLKELPTKMHRAITDFQKNNESYKSASATCVAARVKENRKVEFVSAGDSRALLIRGENIVWQNKEDNMKEFLKARYKLETNEAVEDLTKKYPNLELNSVVQCLGMDEFYIDFENAITSNDKINPHFHTEQAQKGDIVLLCSDGLTDTIPPEQIAKFINERRNKGMSINRINQELKNEVYNKWLKKEGKTDNLSILLIEIK